MINGSADVGTTFGMMLSVCKPRTNEFCRLSQSDLDARICKLSPKVSSASLVAALSFDEVVQAFLGSQSTVSISTD